MMTLKREYLDVTTDGLLIVRNDAPHPARGQTLGNLWYAEGHGAYDPAWGKVPVKQDEVAQHNQIVAVLKRVDMEQSGRAVLYLTRRDGTWAVTCWTGAVSLAPTRVSTSTTNWGHERFDVWFQFGGQRWHGVNIGNNQILRCRRLKPRS